MSHKIDPAPLDAAGTCPAGAGSPIGSASEASAATCPDAGSSECIHGLEAAWCHLCRTGPTTRTLPRNRRRYPVPAWKCGHRPTRRRTIKGTDRAICDDCGGYIAMGHER